MRIAESADIVGGILAIIGVVAKIKKSIIIKI
jgi:hypothetical protein